MSTHTLGVLAVLTGAIVVIFDLLAAVSSGNPLYYVASFLMLIYTVIIFTVVKRGW